jgi:hypothetical protein
MMAKCEQIYHFLVSFYIGKVTGLLCCFRAFAVFLMHSLAGEAVNAAIADFSALGQLSDLPIKKFWSTYLQFP